MSVKLQAPNPSLQTTTFLPNPEFTDSEAGVPSINILRMMDGTKYIYKRDKSNRRRLQLEFSLSRLKALELKAFYNSYKASDIKLTDHLGQVWIGNFISNPFDFETIGPHSSIVGYAQQTIRIEFEGTKQ